MFLTFPEIVIFLLISYEDISPIFFFGGGVIAAIISNIAMPPIDINNIDFTNNFFTLFLSLFSIKTFRGKHLLNNFFWFPYERVVYSRKIRYNQKEHC